ncbi:MAG: CrcB family protein [Mesorhizobium sp.]|nr:CrcB family protein [Mesorhizobium sp.]
MPYRLRDYQAVAAGAALGSVARFLCSLAMLELLGGGFGWGTLTVNVLGSLLIGFYATLTEPTGRLPVGPTMRHFTMAGFCGGFTTFSVFSLETVLLLEQRAFALAGVSIAGSVFLWLSAAGIGHLIAARLNDRRAP